MVYYITFLNYIFLVTYIFVMYLDYLKHENPDEYQIVIEKYKKIRNDIIYNVIYYYSKYQITYNKVYGLLYKFADNNNLFVKNVKNTISQITYDKVHTKDFNIDDSEPSFVDNNDCFYIYSDNINISKSKCVNKIIRRSLNFNTNYEVSNIKFISMSIELDNETYNIKLITDEENYYVVGNKIDKKFLIYYLRYYKHCNLTNDNAEKIDKLDVNIIDHNVNVVNLEITDNSYILIEKNNYLYLSNNIISKTI